MASSGRRNLVSGSLMARSYVRPMLRARNRAAGEASCPMTDDPPMSLSEPYDDRLMADLAAAADGSLDPARQAEIETLAAADPELADALERQRRAVAMIRGAAA